MQKQFRDIILDWGRGHDLLDKLGVPNDAPLAERLRRMLALLIPGKLKGPQKSGVVQTNKPKQDKRGQTGSTGDKGSQRKARRPKRK